MKPGNQSERGPHDAVSALRRPQPAADFGQGRGMKSATMGAWSEISNHSSVAST